MSDVWAGRRKSELHSVQAAPLASHRNGSTPPAFRRITPSGAAPSRDTSSSPLSGRADSTSPMHPGRRRAALAAAQAAIDTTRGTARASPGETARRFRESEGDGGVGGSSRTSPSRGDRFVLSIDSATDNATLVRELRLQTVHLQQDLNAVMEEKKLLAIEKADLQETVVDLSEREREDRQMIEKLRAALHMARHESEIANKANTVEQSEDAFTQIMDIELRSIRNELKDVKEGEFRTMTTADDVTDPTLSNDRQELRAALIRAREQNSRLHLEINRMAELVQEVEERNSIFLAQIRVLQGRATDVEINAQVAELMLENKRLRDRLRAAGQETISVTSPGRTPREERLLAAKSQLEMEVFELKATVKDLKVNDTRKIPLLEKQVRVLEKMQDKSTAKSRRLARLLRESRVKEMHLNIQLDRMSSELEAFKAAMNEFREECIKPVLEPDA